MEGQSNASSHLKEKVALVLGGSRGIGEAIVRRLAGEGAAVALTYITSGEKAAQVVRAAEMRGVSALESMLFCGWLSNVVWATSGKP
jgi:NAD(P)-dependent dehydrogenase (short-subunit alcohol dehydrogenase family)